MNPAEDDFDLDEEAAGESDANEVLVAYLDGQLNSAESERIEAQLATDAAVREKLQSLDRVWNALDALPRSTASAAFTRTTVDMAAVSASQASRGKRRRWRPPSWLLASAVGLVIGALLTLGLATAPERNAVANLPLALNADALENVGSIGFLKSFDERITGERGSETLSVFRTAEAQLEADRWDRLSEATLPERRAWIAALPPDELTAVNSAADRFSDRTSEKRATLRSLAQQLDAEARVSELRETALTYQTMVSRLPASEQARLRQMDDADRLEYVLGQSRRWAREAALELDAVQKRAFRAEIDRLVESEPYQDKITKLARRFPPLNDVVEREPRMMLLAASRFVSDQGRRSRGSGAERFRQTVRARFGQEFQRFENEVIKPITEAWEEWADQIGLALPEPAQAVIREALERSEADRARLMFQLIREALTDDLSDNFVNLPEAEMERLLLVPRDQFTERLSGSSAVLFDFDRGPRGGGPPRSFNRAGGPPGPEGDRPDGRFRGGPPSSFGGRRPSPGPPGRPGEP